MSNECAWDIHAKGLKVAVLKQLHKMSHPSMMDGTGRGKWSRDSDVAMLFDKRHAKEFAEMTGGTIRSVDEH